MEVKGKKANRRAGTLISLMCLDGAQPPPDSHVHPPPLPVAPAPKAASVPPPDAPAPAAAHVRATAPTAAIVPATPVPATARAAPVAPASHLPHLLGGTLSSHSGSRRQNAITVAQLSQSQLATVQIVVIV